MNRNKTLFIAVIVVALAVIASVGAVYFRQGNTKQEVRNDSSQKSSEPAFGVLSQILNTFVSPQGDKVAIEAMRYISAQQDPSSQFFVFVWDVKSGKVTTVYEQPFEDLGLRPGTLDGWQDNNTIIYDSTKDVVGGKRNLIKVR
jgi:hypothetical protein